MRFAVRLICSGFWAVCLMIAGCYSASAERAVLPVPKVTIYPGDAIALDALEERAFRLRRGAAQTLFLRAKKLAGKVARRTLLRNKPVPLNAVREPYLVQQGKMIQAVYQAGGISISAEVLALKSGGLGDVVSARNLRNGAIIRGVVGGDGSLRIGGQ